MGGNSDEKGKCLEKLNEMQTFLPFLDFMINKIKKKNFSPLGCQLSKFQYIRSLIIEKNGRYSLEGLTNIEDVLQKLVTKLDYKGEKDKIDKKEVVLIKSESQSGDSTSKDEYSEVSNPSTSATALAASSCESIEPSDNAIDILMKAVRMPGGQSGHDEKKGSHDSTECAGGAEGMNRAVESEAEDAQRSGQSSPKETDAPKTLAPSDVLADSRRKLLKKLLSSVSLKGHVDDNEIEYMKDYHPSFACDDPIADFVELDNFIPGEGERKGKSASEKAKSFMGALSDISDDELSGSSDSDKRFGRGTESDKRETERAHCAAGRSNGEIGNRTESRYSEPYVNIFSGSLGDVNSKQKLRERLSADIAEVHKVPGKSVGGSLRSLKDIQEKEGESVDKSRDSHSKETERTGSKSRRSDHHRNNKSRRSSKDGSGRSGWRESKSKDSHSRTAKHGKGESRGAERGFPGSSDKKSSGSKEKKERKEKMLEADLLNDQELADFVKENMSALPHLSKLKPEELRRAISSMGNQAEEERRTGQSLSSQGAKGKINSAESSNASSNPDNKGSSKGKAASKVLQSDSVSLSGKADGTESESSDIPVIDITSSPEKHSSPSQSKPDGKSSLPESFVPEKIPVLDTRSIMQRPPAAQNFEHGYPMNYNVTLSQVPRPQISPTLYQGGSGFPQMYNNNNNNGNSNNNSNSNNNNSSSSNNSNNNSINNNNSNSRGDPRGAWNNNMTKENFYSNQFYFHPQGNTRFHPSGSYDSCNSVQRHYGPAGDMPRFQNYNAGWNSNYNTPEPKSYGEYKQLKRQEQECINKSRLGPEERSNSTDGGSSESGSNDPKPMEDENQKTKDSSNVPPRTNALRVYKRRDSKSPFSKSKSGKSFESDRGESKEKSQGVKSSSQEDELISPLDKLYESNPKQMTGRGYGLQKFKIPKKSKSDYQKSLSSDKTCPGSSNQIRFSVEDESALETVSSNSGKSDAVSCEPELSGGDEGDTGDGKTDDKVLPEEEEEEVVEVSSSKGIDAPVAKSGGSFTEERELWDADEVFISGKETDKNEIGDNSSSDSGKGNNNTGDDGERPEQNAVKCSDETEKDAVDKEVPNDTSQTADINEISKKVGDEPDAKNDDSNTRKSDGSGGGVAPEVGDKTTGNAQQDKGKEEKTKTDADVTNKSSITDEITQELVEALITKSFESGEGELLLAKAKLFKEIALKLNSKKLKTIQKIINSESDESSSSSDSSVISEKKKKRTKKKKSDLKKPPKKAKPEKALELKSVEPGSTSGEEENENEPKPEALPPEESQKTEIPEPVKEEEGSPEKNSKKSQRKTKILEQILRQSPTKTFELGSNQSPSESDPKAKLRGKTKGKTELDRLHEDIRSMFISSGVVTATGQRMCRMLRASGGKVNNLDLVKESAKMVEEEKLASHKSGKRNQSSKKARSRNRSNDRMTLRLRSKPKSQGQVENSKAHSSSGKAADEEAEMLTASKNQPVVLLNKINLENFSYAYKIADFPESANRRRGLNVAKRGRPMRSSLRSKTYKEIYLNKKHKIYLSRNLKKCKKFLRKGCKTAFKPKKLTEIIQKLPLKMAKIRHLDIAGKVGGQTKEPPPENRKSESGKKECPEKKSEEDETLNYAFEKNKSTYTCLICGLSTKTITGHYLGKHPESEVLISRLAAAEAEKAVADSRANNYDMTGLEQACTLEVIKRRVKSKLSGSSNYSCRMCTYGTVTGLSQFFSHVSTHTGEYRYKCPIEGCNLKMANRENLKMHMTWKHTKHKNLTNKAIEVFPLPSESGILFGYLCSRCNFVQLLQENMENHVLKTHSGSEDVRIIKIDMSGKPEEEKGKTRYKGGRKKKKAHRDGKNGSDKEDMDQSEDGGESNDDAGDEDYVYNSDESRSCSSNVEDEDDGSNSPSEDDFDEYKPNGRRTVVESQKRSTRNRQRRVKGKEGTEKVLPVPELISCDGSSNEASDVSRRNEGEKEKSQVSKVSQENKDAAGSKENKEIAEIKRSKESKETAESKRSRESEETTDGKRSKDSKETAEGRRSKESKETAESKRGRESEETTDGKRSKESKETIEGKRSKESKETAEGKRSKESKETTESKRSKENNETTVKKEMCDVTETKKNKSHSQKIRKKWEVGPLTAVMFKNRTMLYSCVAEEHDHFSTNSFNDLDGHVSSAHAGETWSGKCRTCGSCPKHEVKGLSGTDGIDVLLKHLESHIKISGGEYVLEKVKNECISADDEQLAQIEESNESGEVKVGEDVESASFPVKPLLRVRSLVGDRLSKPKYNTDDEHSYSGSPIRICDAADESEKKDSEPALFTIKDVRSLNPETEDEVLPDKSIFPTAEITVQKFPPNAEVISGKPVLIRSCPSPKITIRPETNAIPIPVAQAKQAVEAGHLKIVPPPSDVTPIDIKQLEFVTTASIRILSPTTFTSKTMILPTFTSNSRVLSITKPTEAIVVSSKKKQSGPMAKKASSTATAGEGQSLNAEGEASMAENVAVALSTKTVRGLKPILPAPPGESSHELNQNLAKRQQQYSLSFGGKNLKDVEIYLEMLSKSKLCQLFKCMAIECSFTCNNDTIFTQHIGLHVAQQRIKGKKKPQCRSKKIYNWQQCAYCCEVLVTGTALSQHILTEHGHCLYQCSYCFYRAVSESYVALHQNTIHDGLQKEKKVIYKCEPVPGAVLKKALEKPIKPYNVKPYHCELCGTKFYIIKHFVNHLIQKHQGVTAYTCHICKILCFKTDRLIAHYKLHSYSMFQCAYCLHGTETQKEMLFHLCNFHFSQPPLLYGRMTEDMSYVPSRTILRDNKRKKIDNIALDDLKLITCDNDPADPDYILEEVRPEECEAEIQDVKELPISVDLSSIVSELGIDVDDGSKKKKNPSGSVAKEGESEISHSISVENILPNTKFSCEGDAESKSSKEKKEEKDSSVPIGQLPIEVLRIENKQPTAAILGSSDESTKEKAKEPLVDQLLVNLQQNNFSVTVTENKPEENPKRIAHKLPPTIPMNREAFKPKKLTFARKLEKLQAKLNEIPVLLQPIGSGISSERMPQQAVLLALPVADGSTPPASDSSLPAIQNVVSLKRSGNGDGIEGESDARSAKRVCLPTETETLITVTTPQESSLLKISDVRSLSLEEPALQPPIIRVEDFEKVKKDDGLGGGSKNVGKGDDGEEENMKNAPPSPEIIIIDPEETKKSNELIDLLDSEDDGERNEEEVKKVSEDGLEIRKQMEMLRNLMENETDCLLLDDTSQNGSFISAGKQEDSRGGLSTDGENTVNEDSESVDSNRPPGRESEVKEEREEREEQRASNEDKDKEVKLEKSEIKEEANQVEDVKTEKAQELFGKDLYKCGIENCSFSADNINDLRDHLYICDFSRQSQVLSCPHCARQFKHNATYVDHLKNHGEKKYCCGLCSFSSAVMGCLSRHIKQKHRCSLIKTLPYDSFKPGYFVVYPKHHKVEKQNAKMTVFSPGDEDKLPLQSVYQENVKCAQCPYFTKVRSNMVRHLKIHIKSVEAEGSIVVPSTAPTNPVPCLDTKEKMFDKMTNLAASSQLAHANKMDTLSSEEEAKLPQFVPEQMRHKCCSPDCNYLTIDDSMLKHHIKALHDEINVYSCPHCKDTVHLEFRFVPLDKIGQHLKYHDAKLYKCCHCMYFHHQKYIVEKHVLEKHPERRFFVYTVREPKIESASEEEHSSSNESVVKVWKCGLCDDFEDAARSTVVDHLNKIHNSRSKFKCKHCDLKSSQYSMFPSHFASKHNGLKVEVLRCIIQVNRSSQEGSQSTPTQEAPNDYFDTTPLWQRDAPRIRHIRGILIEEEEVKTKRSKKSVTGGEAESEVSVPEEVPPDTYYCPLCTDKKRVFRAKSAASLRTHLYQELNYQQFACILCGKMFVDMKECERHHARSHPNKELSVKQTKGDSEIMFWVNKVVAKQEAQIMEKKRRPSAEEKAPQPSKKRRLGDGEDEEKGKKSEVQSKLRKRPSTEKPERSDNPRATKSKEEPVHKCPHCEFNSHDLKTLKSHIMLKHLQMGKWLCKYCNESFNTEGKCLKHCKTSHAGEVTASMPNPEKPNALNDDFWLEEYGLGQDKKETEQSNVYSCGYCMIEVTDQSSIIDHFEKHHKANRSGSEAGVLGSIYYKCNVCSDKILNFESLNLHARKHPHTSLKFQVRKVYRYEARKGARDGKDGKDGRDGRDAKVKKEVKQEWCESEGKATKEGRGVKEEKEAKEGSCKCPKCPELCESYIDCIDHLNEHYERYSCGGCELRFFTEDEIEKHRKESKHSVPYVLRLPSEEALEEYKSGIMVMKNGVWVPCKEVLEESRKNKS